METRSRTRPSRAARTRTSEYVNDHGGVRGRKIRFHYVDDAYNPAETVRKTRQLVEDDKVFAIFGSVGTEHALAVRPYLNQVGVPQLFVGSGLSALALEHKRYPWTMGYLPRFAGEAALYGRYVARTRPRAKIGVLYEDSEYGQDMFTGLKRGLGSRSTRIKDAETYELSDPDLNAQMARLKASKADTVMIFALPTQTIQAFLAIHKLGWKPRIFVNSVSIDPFVMEVVQKNTGKKLVEGAISSQFLKDPTDPALAKDPGVKLYKQILRRYLPGAKVKEVAHLYGMAVAYTMVDALRRSGAQPTRASLLRAATHLNEPANPFFVKGITVRTGPNDYYPVERTRMLRFHAGRWRQVGRPGHRPLSGSLEVRTLTDGGQRSVDVAEQVVEFLGAARRRSTSRSTTSISAPDTAEIVGGAIKDAAARGVAVRMIYDVGHRNPIPVPPPPEPDVELIASLGVPHRPIAGIPDLMHHKYVVRDGETVWTGSTNWTDDSWSRQENVIAIVESEKLAGELHQELRGALVEGHRRAERLRRAESRAGGGHEDARVVHAGLRRGAVAADRQAHPASGAPRPDLFAGADRRPGAVGARGADRRTASTSPAVSIARRSRASSTSGASTATRPGSCRSCGGRSKAPFSGKPSTPWGPGPVHDFMHAKITVVDDVVFTGSFNLSRSGEQNAENVLEIEDAALADRLAGFVDEVRARYPRFMPT